MPEVSVYMVIAGAWVLVIAIFGINYLRGQRGVKRVTDADRENAVQNLRRATGSRIF